MGYVISAYKEGDEGFGKDGETYVFGTWMIEEEAEAVAQTMRDSGRWQTTVCDLRVRDGWAA